MKEIKFRAWDILGKIMKQDIELWDIKYGEIFPHTPDQRCFNIMQYTGLKDKNGNEIYEGDIVKLCRSHGYSWLEKGTISTIEWDNDEQSYFLFNKFRLTKNKKVEIIGNIYENPGLYVLYASRKNNPTNHL